MPGSVGQRGSLVVHHVAVQSDGFRVAISKLVSSLHDGGHHNVLKLFAFSADFC